MTTMTLPALAAIFLALGADQAPLKAGAATSNITPPLGVGIVGGFVPFPATHVHDELHARCLVLDDGAGKLAIVVCDLLGIDRIVSDQARELIQKDLGIPLERILISATHTHSAGSALGNDPRVIKQTMDEYQRFVALRIVDGVKRANNLLRPAEIGIGAVDIPEHVFNRRWYLRDGTMPPNPFGGIDKVKMNPGAGSKDLLEPAGPTDPTVSFLTVREAGGGKPIALFATYSLHYVGGVGSGHISSDYFGMFCESLAEKAGAPGQPVPFVGLLANGTSGDINNINFRAPRGARKPYEQMRHVAEDVAAKVAGAAAKVAYKGQARLDARYRELQVGTRRPDAAMLEWADKTIADSSKDPAKGNLPAIYARRVKRMAEHPATLPMPLQVLRVGDAAVATMPCEVFCEIGLEYRKRSAMKPAWMVSLAHGYYGYLPTPKHHSLGGYETWMGTNRLEVKASEIMLEQLLAMTAELAR